MLRNIVEKNLKDTVEIQTVSGISNSGSYQYSTATQITKCRIEEGFFEAINNKGDEIKSKTHIINFEKEVLENSKITKVNGVALTKPLIVKASRKTPTFNYDSYLYEMWV